MESEDPFEVTLEWKNVSFHVPLNKAEKKIIKLKESNKAMLLSSDDLPNYNPEKKMKRILNNMSGYAAPG